MVRKSSLAVRCGIAGFAAIAGMGILKGAWASPYDYQYGSMGWYNETARERSYSNSLNYSAPFVVDTAAIIRNIESAFDKPRSAPPVYKMDLPNGASSWNDYWSRYSPPVIEDTRTPQQKLKDSAADGNTIAMWNLAVEYENGTGGFDKDSDKAVFWYEKAARAGKGNAAYSLYAIYSPDMLTGGSTVAKDPIRAMYWLKEATRMEDPPAMGRLGALYLQGCGVDQNATEGKRLIDAAVAAGYDTALISLYYAYKEGWGVEKSLTKAIDVARDMEKRGMGLTDELVTSLLADKDPKSHAAEINALFAAHPNDYELMWLHAGIYEEGAFGERDPKQAIELLKTIVKKGYANDRPRAMSALANHYYTGDGCEKDPGLAFSLFKEAFDADESGHLPQAKVNYAEMLAGSVTKQSDDGAKTEVGDPAKAFRYAQSVYDMSGLPSPLRAKAAMLCAWITSHHTDLESRFGEHGPNNMAMQAVLLDDVYRPAWKRGNAEHLWDGPEPGTTTDECQQRMLRRTTPPTPAERAESQKLLNEAIARDNGEDLQAAVMLYSNAGAKGNSTAAMDVVFTLIRHGQERNAIHNALLPAAHVALLDAAHHPGTACEAALELWDYAETDYDWNLAHDLMRAAGLNGDHSASTLLERAYRLGQNHIAIDAAKAAAWKKIDAHTGDHATAADLAKIRTLDPGK